MNIKNKKYLILIIFGVLTLNIFLPIGDYCRGIVTGVGFIFFGSIFILSFLIFLMINLYQVYKKKKKIDFVLIIIFLFFISATTILLNLENKKFWSHIVMEGIVLDDNFNSGKIILYKNGTFAATHRRIDYSCTYQGNYDLKNDILVLRRENLSELTTYLFTNEYILSKKDSIFQPIDGNYALIQIIKVP